MHSTDTWARHAGFGISHFPIATIPVSREWVAVQTIHKYTKSYISYRKLKAIFECAPHSFSNWAESREAIMVTNDVEPFTIVWVNKAFEQLYGYALSDLQGKEPNVLHGPQTDRTAANRHRLECMQHLDRDHGMPESPLPALTLHTKANVPLVTHISVSHHHLFPFGVQFKREDLNDVRYFANFLDGTSTTGAFMFKMTCTEHTSATDDDTLLTSTGEGDRLDSVKESSTPLKTKKSFWVVPPFDDTADPLVAGSGGISAPQNAARVYSVRAGAIQI